MTELSRIQDVYKLIPVQAAYQAARYARMGHTDLFTQTGALEACERAAFACALVGGDDSQEQLTDDELPAGSQRDDVERILRQLRRDLHDGVLMLVYPNAEQQAQIKVDGIQLHPYRLEVLLAALRHRAATALSTGDRFVHEFMAYQLQKGFLVGVKTN
jgi:hypothetical protein